jgi:glucosylceramidase
VSKFVKRGAVRIDTNTFVTGTTDAAGFYRPSLGLDDIAVVNPGGEKVVVTHNNSPSTIQFAISWRGDTLRFRQPAGATTTFTWR